MDWRHQAACVNEDPETFFPIGATGPALLQIADAKAVCYRCPVIEQCLQWALEHESHGVWGGMSEDDRERFKRRARAARSRARA